MTTNNEMTNEPSLLVEEVARRKAEVRNVIRMTVPVVITSSSRAFMDIVDYLMITGLKEPEAQAAILPAQIIMWCFIIVGIGIVSVVNTFAAQSLGRGQKRDCSAYAWQAVYLALFLGLIGLTLRPMLPGLFDFFDHEARVQALELAYSEVALFTVAPSIMAYGLGWFFVGVQRPWTTMWSAIEANAINIVVSYVLVFGKFGIEPMGIAGAAWGTLVAVTYRALRLWITLLAPRCAREFDSRKTWRPSWRHLKDLLRVGLPCCLQWLCDVVVWAIFVNVLIGSKFGTKHLIATSTAWQYMRIAFMPTIGVGQALTALVGKSIGIGQPERAMRETVVASRLIFAFMCMLSLIYLFQGDRLIGWFSDDPEVIRIGAMIMVCAAIFQLFDGLAITYNAALLGAGDTFVPSLFMIISSWAIIVGGGFAMVTYVPQWESMGAWLVASCLIVITGLFMRWRWRSRAWMNIDLFGGNKDEDTKSKTTQTDNEPETVATLP